MFLDLGVSTRIMNHCWNYKYMHLVRLDKNNLSILKLYFIFYNPENCGNMDVVKEDISEKHHEPQVRSFSC